MANNSKPKESFLQSINWATFLPAGIVLLALVIWGAASPDSFSGAMNTAMSFMKTNFSWAFALLMAGCLIFCCIVAFSNKLGNIRIGGKDAKPTMSFFTWFAISLTAGIAIGILFWGVAEPLTFFHNPPAYLGIEGGTADAAELSLRYVFFHWLLTPYSCFVAAGVPLAYMCYNSKRRYKVSSSLYPLIGDKADGPIGTAIDALCIFGVVGGQTTSLGLGIMQLTGGITFVAGVEFSPLLYLICVLILEAICICAACSGIHKAMTKISHINMYIYFFVLAFVLLAGNTILILNNTVSATGDYISFLVGQSLYLEPFKQSGWVADWSIFYWAWWVAPAPVIGLFLIKLAKGRTMREFVVVNLFAPVLFSIIWFGIFGTTAIDLDMNGAGIMDDINAHGAQVALYSFFQNLPWTPIMILAGFLACVFSVATMHEAMILSLADSSSRKGFSMDDEQGSPHSVKVFWGTCIGLFACLMIITGGLSAVQTSAILTGLPSVILVTVMFAGFFKAVKNPKKFDLTLKDGDIEEEEPAIAKESVAAELSN